MELLIDHCVSHIANNFKQIVTMPVSFDILSDEAVQRIIEELNDRELDSLANMDNEILNRIYQVKLKILFVHSKNVLSRCINCNTLFTLM